MTPQEQLLFGLNASLDEEQRHVASWKPEDGNMRILAAAGSGKTLSLVALTANLVHEGHVEPNRLIVTTFSRKAADEIKVRLAKVVNPTEFHQLRVSTFHSLALQALRNLDNKFWSMDRCLEADSGTRAQGVPSTYEIWRSICSYGQVPGTKEESLRLPESPTFYSAKIDYWRSHGHEKFEDVPPPPGFTHQEKDTFKKVWKMYNDAKKALKAWDFADALFQWKAALEDGRIPRQNAVVIVDEAQDNNIVQLTIAQLLAKDDGRVIFCGDLRQCVHQWRGAYPDLFANSEKTLSAQTRELTTNYRSEAPIVALSNFISHGKSWNLGSPAKASKRTEDALTSIEVLSPGYGPDEESELVAQRIADDIEAGRPPGDYAVLCRTNAGRAMFEGALTRRNVPIAVIGGSSVFRSREAEIVMAYCVLSRHNAAGALDQVLNNPKRFLPHSFTGDVHRAMSSTSNIVDAIRVAAHTAKLKPGSKRGALQLADFIDNMRDMKWAEVPSAIEKLLRSQVTREAEDSDQDRQSLITSVCHLARRFEDPIEFVTFAQKCVDGTASISEGGKSTSAVTLSTAHSAKGLQWEHVYISANKSMFPHKKSGNREEEHRLFYVAVTRAARRVTFAWNKTDGLTPYLPEVDKFKEFLGEAQ